MEESTAQVKGISDLITAMKNSNLLLAQIIVAIKAAFPQTLGTAATATGGAATLPANPVGFLTVTNPATGTTIKIPYYNS